MARPLVGLDHERAEKPAGFIRVAAVTTAQAREVIERLIAADQWTRAASHEPAETNRTTGKVILTTQHI
ncbi:hypothetical protein AB0C81_29050 [Streptomyces roseoverticillatus]|uniref:hypothetical protein n=1 Tax=Streptomyces roseoverticillatus TaxID=66429 RepID=UPI0033C1B961